MNIDRLPQLASLVDGYLALTGVCSLRLFVMLYIFPPTSDGVLQGVVRNAIVVLFSSYVAFGQPAGFAATLHGFVLLEVGLREALIGLALGFSAAIVFWAAEGAGTYVDDLTGYNHIQITNPTRPEQSTPTATLLGQIATMAFWALGGMTFLLGTVYESYHWWPVMSAGPDVSNIIESFVILQTDSLMQLVAKLAAPMVFILLLIDFSCGFAAKSATRLDLMTLAQPVKGAMTLLMLALFVGVFVDQVKGEITLRGFSAQMLKITQVSGTVMPDVGDSVGSSPSAGVRRNSRR